MPTDKPSAPDDKPSTPDDKLSDSTTKKTVPDNETDLPLVITKPSAKESMTRAAGAVGSATLISRILGFVRDMIIADLFGAKMAADAFFVAFRIPNLLRRLTAEGAMTAAFIPVFTETKENDGIKRAFLLASNVLTILATLLILLTCVAELVAPQIVKIIAPGFAGDPDSFALTTLLTRIMLPYLLFISLTAVMIGMLNSMGSFFTPALAPAMLNVVMIISALTLSDRFDEPTVALAVGVLGGGMVQCAMQVWPLIKRGFKYMPTFDLKDDATRKIGLLMIPGAMGMAVAEINILVDTLLASLLPEGSISYLYYGNRVTQFPLGIFGVAVGVAALPAMSSEALKGGTGKISELLSHGLRLTLFVSIPSTIGLIALAGPITNVLFERGEFDEAARIGAVSAIIFYALGLAAFSGVKVVVSAFYALKDTSGPMRVAAWSMTLNVVLNLLLMGPLQHGGLALATSLSSMVNLAALLWLLKKKIAHIDGKKIAGSLLMTTVASLIMGGAVYGFARIFYSYSDEIIWRVTILGLSILLGIIVYFAIMFMMKSEEAVAATQKLGRKFRKKSA